MSVYDYAFAGLGSLCAFLAYKTNPLKSGTEAPLDFTKFQRNYVFVFLVMMMSDWLQGPYVYALYEYYGYSPEDIGKLFIAGFGSSMVFGTMVGSFGDSIGRRKTCILFGFLYIASCVTKHFSNYYILMLGRLLGGVATSLLFSVFEAWMVSEHFSRNFDPSLLGGTFSLAYFGNSIVAITAGLVGGFAADNFGLVAPFDCSAAMLILGTFVVSTTWNENYGNASKPFVEQLQKGFSVVINQKEVAVAGAAQSMFEGAMYTFVFMWTPAMGSAAKAAGLGEIPHGYIFAIFMVSCMIGSCLFKYLSSSFDPKMLLTGVIIVAALGLAPAAVGGMGFVPLFAGFCLFEGSVGFYWPLIGEIRSAVIPEETRSTVMNFFRVPLNLIVVVVLYHIGDLSQVFVFRFCVCLLCMATYLATVLHIPAKTKQADVEFEPSG
uniref:Molybdate-anion transporter n=1 Tax=Lotharella globosa TaxID=91324 RepID=A0A7S4DF87_9EUKA|mmetsp:Transcript_20883/g.40381  ORF Transcript_20883/g.40381 Transcript_20883/m.40381 type:complete len:435 (+) Transcript_20883:53-1357(+)